MDLAEHFRFETLRTELVYDASLDALETVKNRAAQAGRDEELNLLSRHPVGRLLLQSPTGSSRGTISQDRTRLQTVYFGDYALAPSWQLRATYALRKLRRLLALLAAGNLRPSFLALVSEVRISAQRDGLDRQALKRAGATICGAERLIGQNCRDAVDYSSRASCPSGPYMYANSTLFWYQTRQGEVQQPVVPGEAVRVHEWDLAPADDGIALSLDWNNKRGLYEGKVEWSEEELLNLAEEAMIGTRPQFERLVESIVEHYVREVDRG